MPELDIKQSDDSILLTVKVVPASSTTRIAGMLENILKVKVAAAPEKGKANKALTAFFAKLFDVRKKDVTIVSGTISTIKQLQIDGVTLEEVKAKITEEVLSS
jgi:uncharacterized protein (TIGR00251 family)